MYTILIRYYSFQNKKKLKLNFLLLKRHTFLISYKLLFSFIGLVKNVIHLLFYSNKLY